MKKFLLSALLSLALIVPAFAQKRAVPLRIDGDTVLVVKSLPFKVIAPEGAGDYNWVLPSGVEGKDEDNILTVTKAPNGTFVIRVKMVTIDFDAKKVRKDTGEVTVVMGALPQPGPGPDPGPQPNPDPTPKPDDTLGKTLADALTKDADSNKLFLVNKLGAMYTQASKTTVNDSTLTTAAKIDDVIRKTAQDLIGNLTIPVTRDAAGNYLRANLPTKRDTPLDDAARKKYATAYATLGAALEGLK